MKFKALLTSLIAGLTMSNESSAAALAAAGPIDGHEGAVAHALKTLKTIGSQSGTVLAEAQKALVDFDSEIEAAALALVPAKIEEKIIAGEFVRKTEHDLALEKAKSDGEEAATLSFADEKKKLETVTARRLKLTTAHGAVLAGTIADLALQGDDASFVALETEAARRVTELGALGIDPATKENAFKDVVTFSYDDAGSKGFDARLVGLKELGLKPGKPGKDGAHLTRQAPPVTPPAATPDAVTPVYAF